MHLRKEQHDTDGWTAARHNIKIF